MHNQMIPIQRHDERGKNHDDIHHMHQHLVVEARLLIPHTAFVGHSFDERDAEVVEFFRSILTEMHIRCQSGEQAAAQQVSEKVKQRIKQADLFVGVFSRREKIEGKDEWNTSAWVIDEKAYAQAIGKKLILLKEIGVENIGGLQGDYEYIVFDRDHLHKAVIHLIQTIWTLNPGKMELSRTGPSGISIEVLEAAVAAQPEEPMLRVSLAQQRGDIINSCVRGRLKRAAYFGKK